MQEALVAGENRIFRADFATRRSIQDLGGVIVECSVPGAGGVSPTGASGRIVFDGTQALAIRASKMTISLRMRTPSSFDASARVILSKAVVALTNNQFFLQTFAGNLYFYPCASVTDFTNYIGTNAALSTSTEYAIHAVFDGNLAANLRAKLYLQGQLVATTITGSLPAALTAGTAALAIFNHIGGATQAPNTDSVLRTVSIYPGIAFSAADCAADYINNLAVGVTP